MLKIKWLVAVFLQGVVAGTVAIFLFFAYTSNLPQPASVQIIEVLPKGWRGIAVEWGQKLGLPAHLLEATCDYESENTRPRSSALSHKGAVGTCQVLPKTAAFMLGIDEPTMIELVELHGILVSDENNVMFGGRYLSYCYNKHWHKNGNTRVRRALWCYNNGHNKRPKKDSEYVDRVLAKWKKNKSSGNT